LRVVSQFLTTNEWDRAQNYKGKPFSTEYTHARLS
jgi:hypothetical protein